MISLLAVFKLVINIHISSFAINTAMKFQNGEAKYPVSRETVLHIFACRLAKYIKKLDL